MIDNSRYRTVSIPSALSARMDFLMDELGYWLSYDVFVREACLEKICGGERMLMALGRAEERTPRSEWGEEPRRGTRFGSPRETAWRLDASGLIAQIKE
ncbi:MAG: hypothetical protein NWE88_07815 [Candidatus Bathyarchaeota archaeon]|nr:hypothetical protein [Candidatus Bathyarchaeota archaeon]